MKATGIALAPRNTLRLLKTMKLPRTPLILAILVNAFFVNVQAGDLGIFSSEADVGNCAKPGSATFNPATGEFRIAGGGANMWLTNDAFHFVWKEMSGDFRLTADVRILTAGGNKHRKACLLVRQSLAPESAYADVCVHGDGLAALQWRETAGNRTFTIHSSISAPSRLRLERRGDYFSMWLAEAGGELKPAGGYLPVSLTGTVYVGLGVCAHDNNAIVSAAFSNVTLEPITAASDTPPVLESSLETVAVASTDRNIIYRTRDRIEAPNWSRDGNYFLFNSQGRICKLPVSGGQPERLDTGAAVKCNNDHGLSPDGTLLAVSDQSVGGKSRIYVLPAEGGPARQVTPLAPSYWHGWSPDGKTLAYCAERNGNFDIYTIPASGGEETRLTTAPGLDDGPEYSPDGKYIYFNSERSGTMQIWRMKPDGSDQEPVTADGYNNWFAHPSPDGKWIVFLSFQKDVKAGAHPPNKDVLLRLMPAGGGEIRVLARLFGGQGTINVPSWSPDSKKVAFVSYQQVYP
jgi:TolB protein